MNRSYFCAALAGAFALGLGCTRWLPSAAAADATATPPRIVNLLRMSDDEVGPVRPGTNVHSRILYAASGATVAVQSGDVAKHFHRDSDEIQYIVEGSGTFWLGDTKREVGPGDLIVIPKGTAHAGGLATTGKFKAISIKSPPQSADDVHAVD